MGSRQRGSAPRRWRIGGGSGSQKRQPSSRPSWSSGESAAPLLPFFARLCSPSPLLYAGPRGASQRGLIPRELPARSSSSTTAPRPHRRPCACPPSPARPSLLLWSPGRRRRRPSRGLTCLLLEVSASSCWEDGAAREEH